MKYCSTLKNLFLLYVLAIWTMSTTIGQVTLLNEDFSTATGTTAPTGWSNVSAGSNAAGLWSFGTIGGQSLDGSNMAYFDDDGFDNDGGEVPQLTSPAINAAGYSSATLEFDYNYRQINNVQNSFTIDVWDGTSWQNVQTVSSDECGNWGCSYPHASIDITAHLNSALQVRFVFDDGNDWAWYVGIDNVSIRATNSTPIDLRLTAITQPVTSSTCGFSSTDRVEATFLNQGTNTLTMATFEYNLNNAGWQSLGVWTGSLAQGQGDTFLSDPVLDLSAGGSYSLSVRARTPGESDTADNELSIMFQNAFMNMYPYTEDFESLSPCGGGVSCVVNGDCNTLQNGWINDPMNDDTDWSIAQGATATSGTGPMGDHSTGGSSSGVYLYMESSGCSGQEAALIRECLDIDAVPNPWLSFWYHAYGADMGRLYVDVYSNGSWTNGVWSIVGQQQTAATDDWRQGEVDLSSYKGSGTISIRFRSETGVGPRSDMALDDIRVWDRPDLSITGSSFVCAMGSTTLTAMVSGGSGAYTLDWQDENGTALGSSSSISVSPMATTDYILAVDDGVGVVTDTFTLTVSGGTDAVANASSTSLIADVACSDGNGWMHYYHSSTGTLILSLNTQGQNIGNIGDQGFEVSSSTTADYGSGLGTEINAPYVTNQGGWFVMNRYWNVIPISQPTSPVSVRFYYTPADMTDLQGSLGTSLNPQDLYLYKLDGLADPNPDNGHAGVTPSQYNQYTYGASASTTTWTEGIYNGNLYAEFEVESFSGGGAGAGTNSGAFPITLLNFEGDYVDHMVEIEWEAVAESLGERFVLEHSIDQLAFYELSEVPVDELGQQTYTYYHRYPVVGLNYYRLKMIDETQEFSYSGTIELKIAPSGGYVRMFPNPTTGIVQLEMLGLNEGSVFFQLFSVTGEQVHEERWRIEGNTLQSVDLSGYPKGIYLYKVFQGSYQLQGKLIVTE